MFNYRLWAIEGTAFAFAIVTALVHMGHTTYFDTLWTGVIQGWRGDGLNTIFEAITYIGNWQTIAVFCLLLLAFDKTRKRYGYPIAVVAILSSGLNKILKILMARPRPGEATMLIHENGFSYASGHTVTAFAVFCLLAYIIYKNKDIAAKKRIPAIIGLPILAILIGISRVYLGVHYPSDVFGGAILGILIFTVVTLFFYPYKKEKAAWIEAQRAKQNQLDNVVAEAVEEEDPMGFKH